MSGPHILDRAQWSLFFMKYSRVTRVGSQEFRATYPSLAPRIPLEHTAPISRRTAIGVAMPFKNRCILPLEPLCVARRGECRDVGPVCPLEVQTWTDKQEGVKRSTKRRRQKRTRSHITFASRMVWNFMVTTAFLRGRNVATFLPRVACFATPCWSDADPMNNNQRLRH